MARVPKASRKKQPDENAEIENDEEETSLDEQERSKRYALALQLRIKYKKFLRDVDSSAKEKEVLGELVDNYIETLQQKHFKRVTLKKAWKGIQEAASDLLFKRPRTLFQNGYKNGHQIQKQICHKDGCYFG